MFENILIVNKSETEKILIRRILEKKFDDSTIILDTAVSQEAERLLKSFNTDLIIADPDVISEYKFHFLQFLQDDPELSRIPVIIIYDELSSGDAYILNEFGYNNRMPKPINESNLLKCISMGALQQEKHSEIVSNSHESELLDFQEFKKILVVDNSPSQRLQLINILSQKRYIVDCVEDASQALGYIAKTLPDVIIMSTVLPGIDGIQACKILKNDKRTEKIPVIFITDLQKPKERIAGFQAGGSDYIITPYSPEEVVSRIQTHLKLNSAISVFTTQNKKLERKLEERTHELIKSERLALFGQLVQGIVHNIKNPLATMMGYAQINEILLKTVINLEDSENSKEKKERLLDKTLQNTKNIQTSGNRLEEMIEFLLNKASQDHEDEIQEVDLNKIIQKEIEFLEADLWFKQNVKKIIKLNDEPVKVQIIPGMISQVFQNLIRNALDALFEINNPEIEINVGLNGKYAYFVIKDNGPGIPETIKEKIFNPFFTTKPKSAETNGEKPSGTGLGLFICRDMIEYHKGEILLDSFPDQGTSVSVLLPKLIEK